MLETKESQGQTGLRRRGSANGRAGKIDRSIIHLLHRASQRASEIFAQETRDFDLTARQYAVISTVGQHEGLSQTDLVKLTGIDRSTLADVVQRLLTRGIIEREKTRRDGRTYAVSLSAQGRELLSAIKPYARRADRSVLAYFGNEDSKFAADILSRLLRKEDDDMSTPNGLVQGAP